MKIALLRRTHSEYDGELLQKHADLFAGGAQFKRRITRYLPQHDVEPAAVYTRRCRAAHYINYCAPVANFFASALFGCPLQIESEPVERDPFYDALKEDCDALGTDFDAFLRARLTDALVAQSSYWRVEFPADAPDATDKAAWDASGAGHAVLVPVPATAITHWQRDEKGALVWAIEYDRREELRDITDDKPTVTECWTQWRADGEHKRWEVSYKRGDAVPENAPEVQAPYDPTGTMPLVELRLPVELWLLNHLADAQLELFRKRCALSWSIDRTCYTMPAFKLKDAAKPPTMGAGYYLMLGIEESVEWIGPPSTAFDAIGQYIAGVKDELYRVSQQMAAGVDNSAAAIGRSGDSKAADAASTNIVLAAYGRLVREAVEKTYALVSRGRGETVVWHVGGMDDYEHADAGALGESAAMAELLKIPSPTFRKALLTKLALASLPDADEATKAKIREEILGATMDAAQDDEKGDSSEPDDGDDAAPTDTKDVPGTGTQGAALPVDPNVAAVADTALNGAQVKSLLEIVQQAAAGAIPRDSAEAMILTAFPTVTAARASAILGKIGQGFKPTEAT